MAIYESDIRKTKLWLGFLISADVINVWMYEESANSASSRTPTLAKILLRPMQHSIFSGNSSMFSLDSALRNGQPFFVECSNEDCLQREECHQQNLNPNHGPILLSKQ